MKLGDKETKKITTGRLYIKKTGETNWRDMGNCKAHKFEPEIARKDHMASAGGIKRVDLSLVTSIKHKYSFEFDEHTAEAEELRLLATQGADSVQATATVAAEALTGGAYSKKGRTYFTAKQGLSSVVVKVAGTAKTLGTDYSVDPGSGAITILPASTIADNSTVTVDYVAADVTMQNFTANQTLLFTGSFKYVEKDQFSAVPRETTEFDGQAQVTNWGENSGEDYNAFTLEALAFTDPTIKTRKD